MKITIIILFVIFSMHLHTQEVWDLLNCVDYAVESNIDLNVNENNN